MHELYRDSNGNEPAYPRYYRNAEKKLAREQRKLSKMQKGSKNRNKQRIKVAKLHEKISNQRKDFLHKQSRQITNAYDCVCIEDLDMKAMSRSLKFGKSVSDNGWGRRSENAILFGSMGCYFTLYLYRTSRRINHAGLDK